MIKREMLSAPSTLAVSPLSTSDPPRNYDAFNRPHATQFNETTQATPIPISTLLAQHDNAHNVFSSLYQPLVMPLALRTILQSSDAVPRESFQVVVYQLFPHRDVDEEYTDASFGTYFVKEWSAALGIPKVVVSGDVNFGLNVRAQHNAEHPTHALRVCFEVTREWPFDVPVQVDLYLQPPHWPRNLHFQTLVLTKIKPTPAKIQHLARAYLFIRCCSTGDWQGARNLYLQDAAVLNRGDNVYDLNGLCWAIAYQQMDVVQWLLALPGQQHYFVSQVGGDTPLHWCVRVGYRELARFLALRYPEMLRQLGCYGIEPAFEALYANDKLLYEQLSRIKLTHIKRHLQSTYATIDEEEQLMAVISDTDSEEGGEEEEDADEEGEAEYQASVKQEEVREVGHRMKRVHVASVHDAKH